MVKNLVCWWQIFEVLQLQPQKRAKRKIWSADDKFLKFYSCSHKNVQSDCVYVSVGIAGLSCVWARHCTSTWSLQNGYVFGLQDAQFRVPMLLSADTINISLYRTRLSSPSKQGSNRQHQLRLSSLCPWHISCVFHQLMGRGCLLLTSCSFTYSRKTNLV